MGHCGIVVITNGSELRFCAGSNPVRSVSQVCNGKNLQQGSRLEIRPNNFRRSTISSVKWSDQDTF